MYNDYNVMLVLWACIYIHSMSRWRMRRRMTYPLGISVLRSEAKRWNAWPIENNEKHFILSCVAAWTQSNFAKCASNKYSKKKKRDHQLFFDKLIILIDIKKKLHYIFFCLQINEASIKFIKKYVKIFCRFYDNFFIL